MPAIACPSCKNESPDSAKFCVSCGSALQVACTECGSPLPAQARFCPECGHQQGEAQPDTSRATLEQYIPKELLTKLEAVRASGGQLGERRVVTMLFCDVTGSTAAAEKLDPEEWAEIINGAFANLIEPVYRYEGTLARLMGDAILAFFGAPIAHEDDPQRAVLAGLDIIKAIGPYKEEVKRKWGIDFEVRAVPHLVQAGEHAALAYSTSEAIENSTQALEILAESKDADLERRAYEGLGGSFTAINDVTQAVETYHKMHHSAQDSPMQVSALNNLGFLTGLVQGQFPVAEEHLAEADRLARECGDHSGLAAVHMTYCYMRVPFGEFEEAVDHLEEAAEIGQHLELEEPRLFGLTHIANTLTYMTCFEEAREKVLEALPLAEQLGNKNWQSELLGLSTPIYHLRNGDLDAAAEAAQQAKDLAVPIGAAEQEGYANVALGIIAWFRGEYEAAVGYYEEALQAGRTSGIPFIQVSALAGKGAAQLNISPQLMDQITECHTEALELIQSPLGSATGGLAWADLGFCFLLSGNPERANEMFQNGLNTSTAFMYLARPLLLTGSALLAAGGGDIESAEGLLQEARSFAEERAMNHFYPLLSFADANVSLAREDSAKALESFERAESLALEIGMRGFVWQASAGAVGVLTATGQSEAGAAKKAKAVAMVNEIAGLFQDQALRDIYLEETLVKIG